MRRDHRSSGGMRLPRWARWWVYATSAGLLATGALWLLFHHFVRREGAFGPEAHPLEHTWLTLHGAAAFLALWALGLIWMGHVRRGWSGPRNRKNGRTLTVMVVALTLSGWGLYYLGDADWRENLALAHWILGLVAGAWLPLHIWRGRRSNLPKP
jgi:hypothetical protein